MFFNCYIGDVIHLSRCRLLVLNWDSFWITVQLDWVGEYCQSTTWGLLQFLKNNVDTTTYIILYYNQILTLFKVLQVWISWQNKFNWFAIVFCTWACYWFKYLIIGLSKVVRLAFKDCLLKLVNKSCNVDFGLFIIIFRILYFHP